MMWKLFSALLLLAIAQLVSAINRNRYPNIKTNAAQCWNHTGSIPANLRICDPDRIVSDDKAREIHKKAMDIRGLRICPCSRYVCATQRMLKKERGYTITVVLVSTMDDTVTTNFVAAARNYTMHLRQHRGYMGPEFARCDDDIIIFVSAKQEVVYVLTGGTAKKMLTDDEISAILDASESSFKDTIGDGVMYVLNKIREEILKR